MEINVLRGFPDIFELKSRSEGRLAKFWGHVPPINLLPFEFGIQTAWKGAVRNMPAFLRRVSHRVWLTEAVSALGSVRWFSYWYYCVSSVDNHRTTGL